MAVNGGRVGQVAGGLAHHANGATGKGFAEHHSCGSGLKHGVDRVKNLVGRPADMWRKNQSSSTALFVGTLNGFQGLSSPLPHRRIIKIGVKVFVLFDKKEKRTAGRLLD